jgi:hypothetical protein
MSDATRFGKYMEGTGKENSASRISLRNGAESLSCRHLCSNAVIQFDANVTTVRNAAVIATRAAETSIPLPPHGLLLKNSNSNERIVQI